MKKTTMRRSPDATAKKLKENLTFSRSMTEESSYRDYNPDDDEMYCAVDCNKCDGTCRDKYLTNSGVVNCSERISKRDAGVGKRERGKQKRERDSRDR